MHFRVYFLYKGGGYMRGPIDYILVGFNNKKFDGKILKSLEDPLNKGIIKLVALSVIKKEADGKISYLDVNEYGKTDYLVSFVNKYNPDIKDADKSDISEVGEIIDNNVVAGLLVVEQLWAKPFKKALIDAKGVLLAEGRIHPEAAVELDS